MRRRGLVNILDIILVSVVGLFVIGFTFTITDGLRRDVADRSAEDKFDDLDFYIYSSIT